jgi:hypothetical protein
MWLQTRPPQYYSVLVSNMKNDQKEFTWWVDTLKYILTFQYVLRGFVWVDTLKYILTFQCTYQVFKDI